MKNKIIDILENAKKGQATDIHIILESDCGKIRFRQKGIMKDFMEITKDEFKRIVNYLKFIAELDINEHKIPQSGKTAMQVNDEELAIRVSTLPLTLMDEVVVIRILGSLAKRQAGSLFLNDAEFDFFKKYMQLSQGLILFTGPTGSGKSTLMFNLLNEIIKEGTRQVISIEDPVEYEIDGMVQVEINEKADISYAPLLKGALRCDPDVLMFGEIRDKTIARELIRASLSGHLVFSTFHSKSAISTLSRLKDFGLYDEELKQSISLIVNQRILHSDAESFIIYEFLTAPQINDYLMGRPVEYTRLNDRLISLKKEGYLNHEKFIFYSQKFQ
ncbi:competence type IV pilus ATPase ComGA [Salinicoccus halitifaciens]|uniref:Competence protein ComGA n=1 Tax=Salinicoccus halitifaciens TaxID=1073415 RepID=A0ABV2E6K7_9STAP|nr:competence type IV pilus ATPase ComGA [Salinicoccus halitifaciens]MCD2136895.1 Flp pilus assembly complex ATPase component TadA [Salinicoccus halitifaciens]